MSSPRIPAHLAARCGATGEGTEWLKRLPGLIDELTTRWSLEVDDPFDSPEVSASWVAPVRLPDGGPGVLKIGLPHMEADHEAHGLAFWKGDGAVHLLSADHAGNAMLLERCMPGTPLRDEPTSVQDSVVAGLLRRLWRKPGATHPFRPLSTMLSAWSEETATQEAFWPDPGLVRHGLGLFRELASRSPEGVLLATDLHAGNVLRAEREPWLVIDPKPFVGDPAYDATQHLFNSLPSILADPTATIRRFSELLDVPSDRVGLWMLARAAAEPRHDWGDRRWQLAEALAP